MWRVYDCSTHSCLISSDKSVIYVNHFFKDVSFYKPFFCQFFIVGFDLFLPVGERFFCSDDTGDISWLLGLDRIFK